MSDKVTLSKSLPDDANLLQTLCRETYILYFKDYWNDNGLELYMEEQFGMEKLISDLQSEEIDYYFIDLDEKPVGYLKINYGATFEDFDTSHACELEKMYILPEFKGQGIGRTALSKTVDIVRQRGIKIFFLGVLDTNDKAISFYSKIGFKFHSKVRLPYTHFKKNLKGLNLMYLKL